eukprot:scaffold189136_cov31-Tisochrysis_lutea.AAC.3
MRLSLYPGSAARPLVEVVALINAQQSIGHPEHIGCFELGPSYVDPLMQRELEDRLIREGADSRTCGARATDQTRPILLDRSLRFPIARGLAVESSKSGNHLHRGRHSEELRAALCIIDGHVEHERGKCGEDTAGIVALERALNVAAEQRHTRTEHHLQCGSLHQQSLQLRHSREGRSEVRVPESNGGVRVRFECVEHATAHGLCLSLLVDGCICRAVIDKDEPDDRNTPAQVVEEGMAIESLLLIVARHDERKAGEGERARGREREKERAREGESGRGRARGRGRGIAHGREGEGEAEAEAETEVEAAGEGEGEGEADAEAEAETEGEGGREREKEKEGREGNGGGGNERERKEGQGGREPTRSHEAVRWTVERGRCVLVPKRTRRPAPGHSRERAGRDRQRDDGPARRHERREEEKRERKERKRESTKLYLGVLLLD